ncbi:hypothetical protein [Mesonia maritima]|uniref:Lipoprotein n=1 Tax=Mesonia maritima TaxID=1793873 RepID=A0ABU1K333_9FLAO|nr:hypothetical protein [Mesonia maritima]MDR6300015.1 hypothetical protein [Mesonia maritima]
MMNKVHILFSVFLFFCCSTLTNLNECNMLEVALEKILVNKKIYTHIKSKVEKGEQVHISLTENVNCNIENKLFITLSKAETPKYNSNKLWVNVDERFKKKYDFIDLKKYSIQNDTIYINLFYVSKNIEIQAKLNKNNQDEWNVNEVDLIQF